MTRKSHLSRALMMIAALAAMTLLLAGPAAAFDPTSAPNLMGAWTAQTTVVSATTIATISGNQYVITAQEGRAFRGYKQWNNPTTGASGQENFVGVIGNDNRTLVIAEEVDGSHSGELIPHGSGFAISLMYGESGADYKVLSVLLTKAN